MQLVSPSMKYEASYRTYIAELGDEERYPFPLDFDHSDFPRLLRRLDEFSRGINIPEGFVPSTTYWLVDGSELLGVSNLRHYLNERIRHAGGHIGLGVRPAQRGRGLGKLLLKLTLDEARKKDIVDVHIHCHKHNDASARIIKANGGVFDSEIEEPGHGVVHRYVVDASPLDEQR
jgi:predicted acetyltransferase